METIKTYSKLVSYKTYDERLKYLRTGSNISFSTFGIERYLNQQFYKSPEWKRIRDYVIVRDQGCDLAVPGLFIKGKVIVHHINEITVEDLENGDPKVFDMDNLITCSMETHNLLHFGGDDWFKNSEYVERKPNDTCPWKMKGGRAM